jgi:two-component system OmpR family sensor kinase
MTLQTRLVISFSILLLAVIATVGVAASRSIENILVAQTDRTLTSFVTRGPEPRPDHGEPEPIPDQPEPPPDEISTNTDEPFLRSFAELFIAPDGTVLRSEPSGFADDPDPLPDVTELPATSGLAFLDSVDGTLRYRASIETFGDGVVVIRAAPLRDIATATSSLIRALLLAGGGVLLLGGVATWWTVHRAIRPVDEMVETAETIAAGDLTSRVPDTATTSELNRLGNALNEMLTHIEAAVTAERAGQERLRQFVADASHELRTPIAAVSGYAELRRTGGLETPAAEDDAWSRIERESSRMSSLIEELLTLARLGQSQPLDMQPVDLVEIARDAAADHATIDPTRPVELTGADHATINGDTERLHQVVSNLLANVRAHTPEGTATTLELTSSDESVELTVTDNGPGIPEAALEHIFDRFYRADPSRSRRSGGSGLGLAIVDAIVAAHGGTVTATNGDPRGTRITITIPTTSASLDHG